MRELELLAPARDLPIGIAAVDCGADAVYIAGPAFGARHAAGNSVEDIRTLCRYAHRFGVRIFVTFNTLVYERELSEAKALLQALTEAGADAFIVQDPAVGRLCPEGTLLHASTQCAIRTPSSARFHQSLGYGRLVLERQLSLQAIRAIREAVSIELECFVHGALCMSYSGQCYLSEYLDGRSANRGACIQACRSLYDIEDASGKVLFHNKAILSLKDLRLIERLEGLAEAGVQSFKIEGRLKSISYVRNVVRAYSDALDALVAQHPDRYRRTSYGNVRGGVRANLDKTFNRGYTTLYIDGKRSAWSSGDAATALGERMGKVCTILPDGLLLRMDTPGKVLNNGDGFSFLLPGGGIGGFRADVAEGERIRTTVPQGLREGMTLYRNVDAAFERAINARTASREIAVTLRIHSDAGKGLRIEALTEDGRRASLPLEGEQAKDPARARETFRCQLDKRSGIYAFHAEIPAEITLPFLPLSRINELRRSLSEALDAQPCRMRPLGRGSLNPAVTTRETLDYKSNIANSIDREIYAQRGAREMEPAYELTHREGAELMRSRYCVRSELGLCPKQHRSEGATPLYLRNNGRRLRLDFDCHACEMTVSAAPSKKP